MHKSPPGISLVLIYLTDITRIPYHVLLYVLITETGPCKYGHEPLKINIPLEEGFCLSPHSSLVTCTFWQFCTLLPVLPTLPSPTFSPLAKPKCYTCICCSDIATLHCITGAPSPTPTPP